MDSAAVKDLYRQVSDEYNATALAKAGFRHQPTSFGLLEMMALVKYLPPDGVLMDIGTGSAIGPRLAKKLGVRVITVDSPDASGWAAIENAREADIEAHPCDVLTQRLPLDSGTADCVLLGDVIEHLIHSPRPVLNEIHRVLKPGGVCIATTPNAVRLTVRAKMLIGFSNWPALTDFLHGEFHGGHHHEYTPEEFRLAFASTGFSVDELTLHEEALRTSRLAKISDLQSRSRVFDHATSEPVSVWAGKKTMLLLTVFFPRLRSNMLLVARKP